MKARLRFLCRMLRWILASFLLAAEIQVSARWFKKLSSVATACLFFVFVVFVFFLVYCETCKHRCPPCVSLLFAAQLLREKIGVRTFTAETANTITANIYTQTWVGLRKRRRAAQV